MREKAKLKKLEGVDICDIQITSILSYTININYVDINSPSFREHSICGTRCQTGVSQRNIVWICLKRDAIFLLDGVIFDVIGNRYI